MSKAICCNLAKQFSMLKQNCNEELCQASLVEENIDQWEVCYNYPERNKAKVRLRLQFSLTEDLPPKVTVVEPTEVSYICFQEFGARDWPKNGGHLATLLLALRFALSERYSLTNSTGVQKPEDAEKQWLYVKNAHSDWGMPDITALNSAVAVNDAQAARNEARVILQAPVESSSNKEAPANNASQDVSQPKEPSNNNNNP